ICSASMKRRYSPSSDDPLATATTGGRTMTRRFIPSLVVLTAVVPFLAGAEGWPLFRGNALQSGVAASELPGQLGIRLTFKTNDSIEGAAAIVDGTVYVGSMDGHLYALDLRSGQEKWKYKADPIKVSPSVRDGAVYVGDVGGTFHCLDAATGKVRWKFETDSE